MFFVDSWLMLPWNLNSFLCSSLSYDRRLPSAKLLCELLVFSAMEFESYYEISRTVDFIHTRNFTRVALQVKFPNTGRWNDSQFFLCSLLTNHRKFCFCVLRNLLVLVWFISRVYSPIGFLWMYSYCYVVRGIFSRLFILLFLDISYLKVEFDFLSEYLDNLPNRILS